MDFRNKLCVITGGTSGIGLCLARQLAGQGARLLLVARDEGGLQRAATELAALGAAGVATLSADIGLTESQQLLSEAVAAQAEAADLVINCAGVVSAGLLDEVPLAEWRRLLEINVIGLVRVLDATVPAMKRRARATGTGGHVLNVASAAAFGGFPGMAAYGASKAAVLALGESLRAELAPLRIGVTTVCPGFVQTPIADKITLFGRMDTALSRRGIENWFAHNHLSPEVVAARSLRGVRRNQAIVIVGRDARSGYWTKRLAPGLLRRLTAQVSRRSFQSRTAGT